VEGSVLKPEDNSNNNDEKKFRNLFRFFDSDSETTSFKRKEEVGEKISLSFFWFPPFSSSPAKKKNSESGRIGRASFGGNKN